MTACVSLVKQGKFIRINFDASGFIAGANIETCESSCNKFSNHALGL